MTGPGPEHRVTLTVPAAEVTSVMFPGKVKSTDRAVELLGGYDSVASTLKQKGAPLKCRPRAADGLSHSIYSSVIPCSRVLLQVKRTTGPDGQFSWLVSAVARIPTTHEFSGPADFQVVSSTIKPIPADVIPETNPNSPLTAEPTRRSHPLLCLPPVFSRSDATFPYHYKAFWRRNVRTDFQWLPKARVTMLAWDEPVPPVPPGDNPALLKVQKDHPALFKALQELFVERPGWLLPDLHERVSGKMTKDAFQKNALDAALLFLTYCFTQGAFQGVLFHRSFDPRTNADAWALQAVQCAMPDTWKGCTVQPVLDAAAASAGSAWLPPPGVMDGCSRTMATSYSLLVTLKHLPPTKSTFLQVCDVWQHEGACLPLWAVAGAPPDKQSKWGPVATLSAAGVEASAGLNSTEAAPPEATGEGDGSAATGEASMETDQDANEGDKSTPDKASKVQRMLEKCSEQSGWFPRGPWEAAAQQASQTLCDLLPKPSSGTQKADSEAGVKTGTGSARGKAGSGTGHQRLGSLPPNTAKSASKHSDTEGCGTEQGAHNLLASNPVASTSAEALAAEPPAYPDPEATMIKWREVFSSINRKLQEEERKAAGKSIPAAAEPVGQGLSAMDLASPQDEDMADFDEQPPS